MASSGMKLAELLLAFALVTGGLLEGVKANCGVLNGSCAATFPLFPNCCTGFCTNLLTDFNNCGNCSSACAAGGICCNGKCCPLGSFCVAGTCCPDGTIACNGTCCNAGSYCARYGTGTCCLLGTILCNGTCIPIADFQTDNNNCGYCGNKCLHGDNCKFGLCAYA